MTSGAPAVACGIPIMADAEPLDPLFREAVAAVDAGEVAALERLLAAHPRLASDRLDAPGSWLRDVVGRALDDFFARPYLLWFVAEDPVRNGRLPANIAEVARAIIRAAERGGGVSLREQLDVALRLVAWSWIARQCGVQIALIDALIDAGASPAGRAADALVNGNVDAAAHLIERGDALTMATAVCLGRMDEVPHLVREASPRKLRFALVLAALRGRAEGLAALVGLGVDVNAPSQDLYSHATPVHHAVCSGSLAAVRVLVEAGADLDARDTVHRATPLGWAEYYRRLRAGDARAAAYAEIAEYLRARGAQP